MKFIDQEFSRVDEAVTEEIGGGGVRVDSIDDLSLSKRSLSGIIQAAAMI